MTKEQKNFAKWIGQEFGAQRARIDHQFNEMMGMGATIGLLIRSVAELQILVEKLTTKKQRTAATKKAAKAAGQLAAAQEKKKPKGLTPDEMMAKYGGLQP